MSKRNIRFVFAAWVILLLTGCSQYMAYKTVIRKPEKAKNAILKYQEKGKEFILSVKGEEFNLDNLRVDERHMKARARIAPPAEIKSRVYHPVKSSSRHPAPTKSQYDKENQKYILNQVYLLCDSAVLKGDSVEFLFSSVSRIDEIKKDDTPRNLITALGIILLLIGLIVLWISSVEVDYGCFIATACYGDEDAPEVRLLRLYRDQRLMKSMAGRFFVRFYYTLSPPLARLISRSESAKKAIRRFMLEPLVSTICVKYNLKFKENSLTTDVTTSKPLG